MEMERVFRERLRGLRTERGISQKRAASELGLTDTGYRNYELGVRRPTFEVLPLLANFYDVSSDYLLGLTDEPRLPDKETLELAKKLLAYRAENKELEKKD